MGAACQYGKTLDKPDGPNQGSTVPLEELKDDAYAVFGWDQQTGIPQEALLRELGIIP